MRVINLGSDPTIFSVESAARARMRLQASAVDELHIISPAPESAHEEQDGNLFLHPIPHGKVRRITQLTKIARELIYARAIDVVSAQDPFVYGLAAVQAVRGTSARLSIQVHTDLSAQSWVRRLLARWVLRRAHAIRVVSEKIKNDLAPLHLRAPITVLPIFIDLEPFIHVTHHAHPQFKKVILWIGRFEPEKNPREALQILKAVRGKGADAGLIMLGAGSLEAPLREQTRALGLSAYVEFPGWSVPAPYLAMADVVVSTSLHESYGASMVEALAARVPVVAPDIGIAREAGARVVPREGLAEGVLEALRLGQLGVLKLTVLTASEWVSRWRTTLP